MSLADELLKESARPKAAQRPTSKRPARKKTVGRSIKPTVPVTESVAYKLNEAVEQGRGVQLTVEQARGLCHLIERMDGDPFQTGGVGKITTDDLKELGLKMADSSPEEDELGDPFLDPQERDEEMDLEVCYTANNEEPIPVAAAITAPDATPGGSEDVPIEVIKAMQALISDDEEVPMSDMGGETGMNHNLRQQVDDAMTGGEISPDEGDMDLEPDMGMPEGPEPEGAELAVAIKKRLSDSIKKNPAASERPTTVGGQDMRATMNRWRGRGSKKSTLSESEKAQKRAEFEAKVSQLGG